MSNREPDILREASEKGYTVIGRVEHGDKRVELGVRLLPGGPDASGRLWSELIGCRPAWNTCLLSRTAPIQFHFTTDRAVVFFESAILAKRGWPWRRKRLLLQQPANLRIAQRRRHERVRIPDDVQLDGMMTPVGAEGPAIPCRLTSVSYGGLAVAIAADKSRMELKAGQAVQVMVDYRGPLTLDAAVRRSRTLQERWVVLGLELKERVNASDEAMEVGFGRLVGDMMRLQIRRHFRWELRKRDDFAAA